MYDNRPAKNPNTPTEIRKRIASLRKQIARNRRIESLLEQERELREQVKGKGGVR